MLNCCIGMVSSNRSCTTNTPTGMSCPFLPNAAPRAEETSTDETHTVIHRGFQLPIEYLDASEVHVLSDIVAADLELTVAPEPWTPMYHCLANPAHSFGKNMIEEFKRKYTTHVGFLTDTQAVLSEMDEYHRLSELGECSQTECDRFEELWKDTKLDPSFLEKYSFMEWDMLKHLNHSSSFLQCLSFINITSPVLSLFIPVLFLVIPFLLIRMRSIPITFREYMQTLKEISRNHFIGKMLNIKSISPENIAYVVMIGALYFLQLYQNALSCVRFYRNLKRINTHLCFMQEFLEYSIKRMRAFAKLHGKKSTYAGFCADVVQHADQLTQLHQSLKGIRPFSMSVSKFHQIGYMLQQFYQIYSSPLYETSLRFSVGFEGYVHVLAGVADQLSNGTLGKAVFVDTNDDSSYLKMSQQVYPPHAKDANCVKNTCSLDKNMIITGVNASGKTTFLKTAAINVILTQQFGCGFYRSCRLRPYTHIHSYLNIPDTSGRDSLFQAESRRCKEIIDAIEQSVTRPGDRHFCIFDELYSGTNPKDATKSACSFLRYLSKRHNVDFILTTHYVEVCKKFRKSDRVRNCQMDVKRREDGSLAYTYRLKKGISKIEGGVEILRTMNYPEEILAELRI